MTSRRNWIATGLAAGAFTQQAEADLRNEFPIVRDEVCLNNAHWHPLSTGARAAVNKYLDFKSHGFGVDASLGMHVKPTAPLAAAVLGAVVSRSLCRLGAAVRLAPVAAAVLDAVV